MHTAREWLLWPLPPLARPSPCVGALLHTHAQPYSDTITLTPILAFEGFRRGHGGIVIVGLPNEETPYHMLVCRRKACDALQISRQVLKLNEDVVISQGDKPRLWVHLESQG